MQGHRADNDGRPGVESPSQNRIFRQEQPSQDDRVHGLQVQDQGHGKGTELLQGSQRQHVGQGRAAQCQDAKVGEVHAIGRKFQSRH